MIGFFVRETPVFIFSFRNEPQIHLSKSRGESHLSYKKINLTNFPGYGNRVITIVC